MTMFEMIDELEPLIPEQEMKRYYADHARRWRRDNPEAFKRLYTKNNLRRKKKDDINECDLAGCR